MTTPRKIAFGQMREDGTSEVVVYCRDYRCYASGLTHILEDRQGPFKLVK
jgi:hypothetical protein